MRAQPEAARALIIPKKSEFFHFWLPKSPNFGHFRLEKPIKPYFSPLSVDYQTAKGCKFPRGSRANTVLPAGECGAWEGQCGTPWQRIFSNEQCVGLPVNFREIIAYWKCWIAEESACRGAVSARSFGVIWKAGFCLWASMGRWDGEKEESPLASVKTRNEMPEPPWSSLHHVSSFSKVNSISTIVLAALDHPGLGLESRVPPVQIPNSRLSTILILLLPARVILRETRRWCVPWPDIAQQSVFLPGKIFYQFLFFLFFGNGFPRSWKMPWWVILPHLTLKGVFSSSEFAL